MGQYHHVAALDREGVVTTIDNYALGCGLKLMEQAWAGSPYVAAIGLEATLEGGSMHGSQLFVIGDYAEGGDPDGGVPDSVHWYPALSEKYPTDDEAWVKAGVAKPTVNFQTKRALGIVGEAMGYSFEGEGWASCVPPDDIEEREARWRAAPGDDVLVAVLPSLAVEYLDPARFNSPTTGMFMPLCGGAWPAALTLLAMSDGKGGGDARINPPGRWTGAILSAIPRSHAEARHAVDITDWYQKVARHEASQLEFA